MKLFIFLVGLTLSSCASFSGHEHNKDRVFESNADGAVKICSSNSDLKIGSKIKIFDFHCKREQVSLIKVPRYETKCYKKFTTQAEITESLGSHHFLVKPIEKESIQVGQMIE